MLGLVVLLSLGAAPIAGAEPSGGVASADLADGCVETQPIGSWPPVKVNVDECT